MTAAATTWRDRGHAADGVTRWPIRSTLPVLFDYLRECGPYLGTVAQLHEVLTERMPVERVCEFPSTPAGLAGVLNASRIQAGRFGWRIPEKLHAGSHLRIEKCQPMRPGQQMRQDFIKSMRKGGRR